MGFLAPLWLALGAAVAVPLLIHLLRRRIGARVDFPAARYLARAEQEHSRKLRLRNLLLMFLRVAIVLALALAAARPVTRWVGAGHAPTALAIVLDNSLSTQVVVDGKPLFATIEAVAHDAAARGVPGDRLFLVTMDGAVRGGSPSGIDAALGRVQPLDGAGDARLALARAAAAVRASGLDARQILLITDAQRSQWSAARYDAAGAQLLVWSPSAAAPTNRAVLSADARPARWSPSGAVEARLLSDDSASYRVELAGRTLARGSAAPGDEILIHATPPERGWVGGSVELEPDELPADNVRYFAAWIGAAPGVAATPGAGSFVATALDALRAGGRIAQGHDVAVASADELVSLPALVVAPAAPVRIGAANRALERAGIPWRYGQPRTGDATVRGPQVDGVTAALRYQLVPQGAPAADTLATVGGEPWIVAGDRYVLVGSPIDPQATSFPVRASFLPWLATVLTERLPGEAGGVVSTAPGARLARPAWADELEPPDGARLALADSFDVPARAGTYFFVRNGRRVGALVVNPESQESVLDRWSGTELAERLRADRVQVVSDRAALAALAFRGASRRSLIAPLLFAALALLAVEAALVRAGTGRVA